MKYFAATLTGLMAVSALAAPAFANEAEDKAAGIDFMPAKDFVRQALTI